MLAQMGKRNTARTVSPDPRPNRLFTVSIEMMRKTNATMLTIGRKANSAQNPGLPPSSYSVHVLTTGTHAFQTGSRH